MGLVQSQLRGERQILRTVIIGAPPAEIKDRPGERDDRLHQGRVDLDHTLGRDIRWQSEKEIAPERKRVKRQGREQFGLGDADAFRRLLGLLLRYPGLRIVPLPDIDEFRK